MNISNTSRFVKAIIYLNGIFWVIEKYEVVIRPFHKTKIKIERKKKVNLLHT